MLPGRHGAPSDAELIEAGAGLGYLIYPARLPAAASDLPEAGSWPSEGPDVSIPPRESRLSLESQGGDVSASQADRSWAVEVVHGNLGALDALAATGLPPHLLWKMASELVWEALHILHAAHGVRFVEEPEALARWRALAAGADCPADALEKYLALRGAALLAHVQHWDHATQPVPVDLARSREFLAWLEGHLIERYSAKSELRRRRWVLRTIAWSPVPAMALAAIGYVVHTWPETPVAVPDLTKAGGITGQYFEGKEFDTLRLSRTDRSLDFSSSKALAPGLPHDNFSVRWEGLLAFPEKGAYSLCVESDDGNRLTFNGRLVIDDWEVHPVKRSCTTVHVRAGWYPIRLEYFEQGAKAVVKLLRKREPGDFETIRPAELCCGN